MHHWEPDVPATEEADGEAEEEDMTEAEDATCVDEVAGTGASDVVAGGDGAVDDSTGAAEVCTGATYEAVDEVSHVSDASLLLSGSGSATDEGATGVV